MNKEDIRQLYNFNKWANTTALKSVAALSTEELTRHLGGSFPCVRDTLVHIMAAGWIWLRRWKGVSPPALFDAAEFPGLHRGKVEWLQNGARQMDFVDQMSNESLIETITYVN